VRSARRRPGFWPPDSFAPAKPVPVLKSRSGPMLRLLFRRWLLSSFPGLPQPIRPLLLRLTMRMRFLVLLAEPSAEKNRIFCAYPELTPPASEVGRMSSSALLCVARVAMLHEPKFWSTIFFLGELLAGGIAAVMEKYRKIGFVAMGMASLGLLAIFFFWPEAEPNSPSTAVSIKQEGTTTNSPNVVGNSNTLNLGVSRESPSPLSLAFTSGMATLPITIEPHKRIYVLELHPKITQDLGGAYGGDKPTRFPADWPKTGREMMKQKERLGDTMIWRCEITNPNGESLLGIVMTFAVTFREPNATGGSNATDPIFASHQHPIEVPNLKPQESFVFYLINESPYFTVVDFPDHAQADVVGRVGRSNIPIVEVGTNPLERMPIWSFAPTHTKWHTVSWGKGETN
jgi:hypothetical protein